MSGKSSVPQASEHQLTTIRRGDTELTLAPGVGGSVASFRVSGMEVLRSGSPIAIESRNPLGLGAFPLFPFSGRIADGRFRHGDQEITLRPNFPPEPHAIHGQGWQNAWRLAEFGEDSALLVYQHDIDAGREDGGDGWPWCYRAEQRFEVSESELVLSLSLTNLAATAMPAGMGWHPYFPKGDALLSADVSRIWLSGGDMIPLRPTPIDSSSNLRSPRGVSTLDLDNAFDVGREPSTIRWPERAVEVTLRASDELGHLVVYTPTREDYFCVEPTSHAPDAVNSALPAGLTGYRELGPGETLSARIGLEVDMRGSG